MGRCGLDTSGSGYGPVAGSCEHGNEPLRFIKEFLDYILKKGSAFFMEPEGSLPCSQKPDTGPYPDPAESFSPHRSVSS
jgi:hypothetical protein